MVQCNKCKLFLSVTKDEVVKCKGVCETIYHKKCVLNNKQFIKTSVCDDCQKNKGSPAQPISSSTLNINMTEASAEKVLMEVNKKLEVLYNVERKISDLTNSVEFYADIYQTLIEYKEESQKKIKALEQKNIYLEKYNKALEERIQALEVKEREAEIEIHGLEAKANEDVKEVVQNIAKVLKLNPEDVEIAERVGRQKLEDAKPKVIVATLRSKGCRKNWLIAKKERKITNDTVYKNGNNNQVFINEGLPKFKRQLLWTVRNKLKPLNYQYIWVQNGNILVKKNNDDKRIYNISSEKDLDKFQELPTKE
ncbi:hypothetical protein HW555_012030 [Spodoptera exigua]|uniref:Zinc finger PHD-type domain-containing protein n=1 Tax=Spodoptera exigua TaxID=7107 RepID=A0A835L144_SPOEX|nr:hypothetical protein HW555_012030 [Spodoptera exigua]